MEILLTTCYTVLFIVIIYRWEFFSIPKVTKTGFAAVFVMKVMLGVLLGMIYTFYYKNRADADIFKYFDDSKFLHTLAYTHPKHFLQIMFGIDADAVHLKPYYRVMNYWYNKYNLYNDNRTMIKLNTLLRFFSGGFYYVHSVFMCFFSLIGLTGIFKVFNEVLPNKVRMLFAIVFFVPSVLFWTSGMLKDGLLVFAFGTLFYSFHSLMKNNYSIKNVIILLSSVYLLTLIKLYVLVIIAPGLFAYFWAYKTNMKRAGIKFATVYILALVTLFNLERLLPQYNFKHSLHEKQHNFLAVTENAKIGSLIYIKPIDDSPLSVIKAIPTALSNLLFRPHIFEAGRSPFILLAAVENLAMLIFMGLCLFAYNPSKRIGHPLFYFSFWYVLLLFILTGLVTPVMGAFVRYKVPALPFLLVMFVFMYDRETLTGRLPFLSGLLNRLKS